MQKALQAQQLRPCPCSSLFNCACRNIATAQQWTLDCHQVLQQLKLCMEQHRSLPAVLTTHVLSSGSGADTLPSRLAPVHTHLPLPARPPHSAQLVLDLLQTLLLLLVLVRREHLELLVCPVLRVCWA
jgi:hypothetical protein